MKSIIDSIPAIKAIQGKTATPFFKITGNILGFCIVGMFVLAAAIQQYALPSWTNTIVAILFGTAMVSFLLLAFRYLGQQRGRDDKPQGITGALKQLFLYMFLPVLIIASLIFAAMYIHYLLTGTPYFTEPTKL